MMKLFICALACSLFIGGEAVSNSDWEAYKQEFGKVYSGDEEHRRSIFNKNLLTYAELNALEPLAHYGPNKFSDMERSNNGYTPSNIVLTELEVDTSLELSTGKDWTGVYTTPIKDQGSCGSCWAESAIQQIESDAMREHKWTGVLSTQELVDCTAKGQGSWAGGCGGGNPTDGYDTLQTLGGVVSGYDYTYEGKDDRCRVDNYTKYAKVVSYKSVGKMNETTMKSYIDSTGPLSVCVDATSWSGYSSGIKTTCGTSIDHCVQLVGWGSEKGVEYWNVRNSWGGEWGEKGHIRLEMGKNLCKLANGPTATSTAVKSPAPVPSPSPMCSDLPLDWRSSEGDPCSIYDLNSYCTHDGQNGAGWNLCAWGPISDYADSKGNTAFDACCACGGGSHPSPTPPPTPAPPKSTCTDKPTTWRSSEGDSCCAFKWNSYCTPQGGEGPSWDHNAWGPISDYADKNGIDALEACCVCGGGSNKTTTDDDEKFD
jgi:KDEL-tailed cysteine endopeptidase